jgi:hypothetical protein
MLFPFGERDKNANIEPSTSKGKRLREGFHLRRQPLWSAAACRRFSQPRLAAAEGGASCSPSRRLVRKPMEGERPREPLAHPDAGESI